MNLIKHEIVDCKGFEIVKSWPWGQNGNKKNNPKFQNKDDLNWGFLVCSPIGSMSSRNKPKMDRLYGVIGPVQTNIIRETCLGIPLNGAPDLDGALAQFALSCGLSIIEKAQIELGDMVVVSGVNPLALSILVAAKRQCARTACLVTSTEAEMSYKQDIEKLVDSVIEFEYTSSFNARFDEFIAASIGKTVYIDGAGQPGPVHVMAMRMQMFGTLLFCRQEVNTSVVLKLREIHHHKSAKFMYWARPENLEDALRQSEYTRHAARLFNYKRVFNFITDAC